MNRATADKLLAAAAPTYKTSKSTKNAYLNYRKVNKAWNNVINGNIKKYNAMGDFDPQKSAYYQDSYRSMKQVYKNQGRRNMLNSIAAAAANTGGYGNSYGTTAGNQAYQQSLAALAAQVPKIYSAASSEFANRKNNLANLIGMQQQQQTAALNNGQFMVNTQQALDEARYNADVAQDSAKRDRAKLWYQIYGTK